jgi:hypothetical protein
MPSTESSRKSRFTDVILDHHDEAAPQKVGLVRLMTQTPHSRVQVVLQLLQ